MDNSIFVENDTGGFVLEEDIPILDRLDIIENRMKLLENKINKCCDSSRISPVFSSVSSGRRSPSTIGRISPDSQRMLDELERSGNKIFLPQRKKAGKRKTRKNKNKRKNKKIRTRRYKK
tara:strand:- start:373 stop:732 length:360 start_codon:yes stop_codon:yes gene_type:complete